MDKKNKYKIMKEALQRYNKLLSLSDTKDVILHKAFKEKLARIEPKISLAKNIKSKINTTTSIVGSSLFITGFLIARLTLPVGMGVKGIENNSYIEDLPTQVIAITSEEKFKKIMMLTLTKEISSDLEIDNNIKQLYIKGLQKNSNKEFKKLLNLRQDYEGPLTIIISK